MPKRKPKDPERSPDLPHNWISRRIASLSSMIYSDPYDIPEWRYRSARLAGPGTYEGLEADWGSISLGEYWGGEDATAFFETELTVPESHAGDDIVLDLFLDGGEAQLSVDGRPYQGLDWHRSIIPFGEFAQAGRKLKLEIEAFIINYPYDDRRKDARELHRFERARLLRRDAALEAAYYDLAFLFDAYMDCWENDGDPELEAFYLRHLERVCRMLPPEISSREEMRRAAAEVRSSLADELFANPAYRRDGTISICGHSHLDIVYLWPIKETFRKNVRTATNMLSLMREYPDYKFSCSQPYLYEKLKEMYPSVYEEIKERIAEGRWEAIGGMYVEPDGNLLGPESLVRQILFGKRFFRREFGVETETCWLPDVFGVMYTLPQILKKSGIKYFCTNKLNIWNDVNEFPHDTFRWRGPDGSEVLVHFPTTHFGQDYRVANLQRSWSDFREKQTVGENLFIYGWADGGGGPTREMVEGSIRTDKLPGLPGAKIEFAEEYFRRAETKWEQLAVWDDELYLEAHRGTITTKADLKRQNRQAELLYRDAEILSSLALLFGGEREQERLNEGWKRVMLNQFHDTLPGTHAPAGVPDIKRDYEEAFKIGYDVRDRALACLASRSGAKPGLVAANTLSWERADLLLLPGDFDGEALVDDDEAPIPVQRYGEEAYARIPALPSLGWRTLHAQTTAPDTERSTASFDGTLIETPFYRIELNSAGEFGRLYDKEEEREVLSGPGNQFQIFEDDPGYKFSAWDVAYHLEEFRYTPELTSPWSLAANGPHFAVLKASWKVLDSTIEQEIWLYSEDRRIDFRTRADWHNHRKMWKVAFPLNVRTKTAVYDLPFGHIERPTTRNTSWEQAKFEVCGHKWADLSEGDYGVALMNDCKYGYDARENLLRLSLLRSPVRPDPGSDEGEHLFTYSLLPHRGGWRDAQVTRRAYELNSPVLAASLREEGGCSVPESFSLARPESGSLIVEAVKQPEEGEGLILRSFDSLGTRGRIRFTTGSDLEEVKSTDLLEENESSVPVCETRAFGDDYTPYEIKTHRLLISH